MWRYVRNSLRAAHCHTQHMSMTVAMLQVGHHGAQDEHPLRLLYRHQMSNNCLATAVHTYYKALELGGKFKL
jgi:hypothetical protein